MPDGWKDIGYKVIGYRYIYTVAFLLICLINLSAQTKTNLDIFYLMVDSSAHQLVSQIPISNDTVKIDLNLGESYSLFRNKINAGLMEAGKVSEQKSQNALKINYVIDDVNVTYGDMYRDGLFGDYYLPRFLSLKGNYLIQNDKGIFKEFKYAFNDSIKYEEINSIENDSYPFTKGDVPSEPFFSGLFEPIVAIGTTALAVILFFTIRSK